MSKIDNPMYGRVGAFWIEGNNEPFYGITEARQYQYDKGGDVLNFKGKVAIHDPEPNIAICSKCAARIHGQIASETSYCEGCTPAPPLVKVEKKKKESKGFFNIFGMM